MYRHSIENSACSLYLPTSKEPGYQVLPKGYAAVIVGGTFIHSDGVRKRSLTAQLGIINLFSKGRIGVKSPHNGEGDDFIDIYLHSSEPDATLVSFNTSRIGESRTTKLYRVIFEREGLDRYQGLYEGISLSERLLSSGLSQVLFDFQRSQGKFKPK